MANVRMLLFVIAEDSQFRFAINIDECFELLSNARLIAFAH